MTKSIRLRFADPVKAGSRRQGRAMPSSAAREWAMPELLSDLPYNIELEQALLGALLISNASYHRVSPLVTPADFYEPLHGRLFEAIGDLVAKNSPATPLTLTPFFEAEMFGAQTVLQYLGRLVAGATNVVNAEHHAAAIADLRRRRKLASIGVNLVRSALHDFTASLEAQIAAAVAELYALWAATHASTASRRARPHGLPSSR